MERKNRQKGGTMQHCDHCGYVHIWLLKLTDDFKKKVVDYLKNMDEVAE